MGLVISMLLPAGTISAGQQVTQSLRGMVRLKSAAAAPPYIRIRLMNRGETAAETFLRDGRFEFINLGPGRYTLVVEAAGFETVNQDVIMPDDWFTFIELRANARSAGKAEVLPVWEMKIPEVARRQFAAGREKLMQDHCDEALIPLRKAIGKYAEYGDAHRAMGECYVRMGQTEAAEKEFKKALELPHLPDLHLELGKIYAQGTDDELLARQIRLFVEEEKPGALRDRMEALLERYHKQ